MDGWREGGREGGRGGGEEGGGGWRERVRARGCQHFRQWYQHTTVPTCLLLKYFLTNTTVPTCLLLKYFLTRAAAHIRATVKLWLYDVGSTQPPPQLTKHGLLALRLFHGCAPPGRGTTQMEVPPAADITVDIERGSRRPKLFVRRLLRREAVFITERRGGDHSHRRGPGVRECPIQRHYPAKRGW
jgi:hypothetical protein